MYLQLNVLSLRLRSNKFLGHTSIIGTINVENIRCDKLKETTIN